jgi:hypothetical protein
MVGFDMQNDNLEIELGKEQYQDKMPEIKKIIWEKVNQADISVLEKIISNNTIDWIFPYLRKPIKYDY